LLEGGCTIPKEFFWAAASRRTFWGNQGKALELGRLPKSEGGSNRRGIGPRRPGLREAGRGKRFSEGGVLQGEKFSRAVSLAKREREVGKKGGGKFSSRVP